MEGHCLNMGNKPTTFTSGITHCKIDKADDMGEGKTWGCAFV